METIALIGGSGTIGQRLLKKALSSGHKVVGIVRDPSGISEKHRNLHGKVRDVLKPEGSLRHGRASSNGWMLRMPRKSAIDWTYPSPAMLIEPRTANAGPVATSLSVTRKAKAAFRPGIRWSQSPTKSKSGNSPAGALRWLRNLCWF